MGCGWRVGGWCQENNATLWLHLASWNLPDSQLSWESKMEPSLAKKEKTDEKSGHFVIASSRPPEARPLEHSTLVPKRSIGFDPSAIILVRYHCCYCCCQLKPPWNTVWLGCFHAVVGVVIKEVSKMSKRRLIICFKLFNKIMKFSKFCISE